MRAGFAFWWAMLGAWTVLGLGTFQGLKLDMLEAIMAFGFMGSALILAYLSVDPHPVKEFQELTDLRRKLYDYEYGETVS
jgi:multisubunit Na+/H+ antiporter MnhC subunit